MTPAWTIALALLARADQPAGADELAAPSGSVATRDKTRAEMSTRIGVGILRAEGFDDLPELERAIRLRLPALTLVPAGQPAPAAEDGSLRAFIELRRQADRVELTLILADGRAYLRELEVGADAPARPAASALANLVAGIEDDSVTPDKEHVALPPALVEPAPAEPILEAPVPKVSPPEPPPAVAPAPVLPRWELGPLLRFGGAFGLTPPRPGIRGAGPAVGLEARAPSGLLLALDLQWISRAVDRYHLQRVRIAVGVGYALRRGGFELPAAALVGVEPWWLGDGTGRVPLASPSGRPGPLLGLGLRLSPGFTAPLGTRGARLRVGARFELWASGQIDAGLRRPELRLPPTGPGPAMLTTPSASLGGLELQLGLEVGVWLPVGAGREHRSRRTGR